VAIPEIDVNRERFQTATRRGDRVDGRACDPRGERSEGE
jgi:hypothetical protein